MTQWTTSKLYPESILFSGKQCGRGLILSLKTAENFFKLKFKKDSKWNKRLSKFKS